MKSILAVMALFVFSSAAQADSVAQEIRVGSVLTLKQGVAQVWANNLEAAQSSCSYCAAEPDSLELSIEAVLRAVALEASFGIKACGLYNCTIANLQSTVAIDDRVGVVLTPSSLNFGLVSTPEPTTWVLMGGGLLALVLSKLFMGGWRGPKNI